MSKKKILLILILFLIPLQLSINNDVYADELGDLLKELPDDFTFSQAPSVRNGVAPYNGSVEQLIDDRLIQIHEDDTRWLEAYQIHENRGEQLQKRKEFHQALGAANERFIERANQALSTQTHQNAPPGGGSPQNVIEPALYVLKDFVSDITSDIKTSFGVIFDLMKIHGEWVITKGEAFNADSPVTPEELEQMRESFNTLGDPALLPITPEAKTCTVTMEGPEHISRHIIFPLFGTTTHEQKLKWIPCVDSAFVVIDGDLLYRWQYNVKNSFDLMKTYDSDKDGKLDDTDEIWDKIQLLDHYGNFLDPDNLEIPITSLSYNYKRIPDDSTPAKGSYMDKLDPDAEHFRAFAVSYDGVTFSDGTTRDSYATPQQPISDCSTYDAKYFFAEGSLLLGEYEKALAGYQEITKRCPDVSHGIAGAASILHRIGAYEEALVWYGSALQIDPKNYYYITDVAEIYYLLGETQRAQDILRYSYELNPDHKWTITMMGKLGMNVAFS